MDRQVLFSLALCANRSFSKLDVSFRCAGAVFHSSGICDPGVVALRYPAWQARDSVCASVIFVGPVVQSARFGEPETCQNWSKSFWRHSPVPVFDACRKRVKVGLRGRSSSLDDFEFVASLLCVTGAALSSVLVEFCGRRSTLELFACKFRGRRSTLAPGCRFRGRHVTLTERDRSRCGAVHILSVRSEPSAHLGGSNRSRCGAVRILSMRSEPLRTLGGSNRSRCGAVHILSVRSEPSAHLGGSNRSRCGAVRILSMRSEPLRTLGGSNRSRSGAVHMLSAQSEPSAHFGWVESLSLWRGAHLETEVSFRSVDHKCPLEVSFRSFD